MTMANMLTEDHRPSRRTRLVDKTTGEVVAVGTMRMVPVSLLRLDPGYQRDTNLRWVAQQGLYDEKLASALIVSERGGILWVVDGGHRKGIAEHNGVHQVWCLVISGLTKAAEAALYIRLNKRRTALTSWSFWQAGLAAGDAETVSIQAIVQRAGFEVSRSEGPRAIVAIDALRYIHRYGGAELLEATLEHIRRLWFEERASLGRPILKGLALFLASAQTDPHYRGDRLARVMDQNSPTKLIRLGQEKADRRRISGLGAQDIALAIHEEYLRLTPKRETPLSPLKIGGKTAARRQARATAGA